MNYSKFSRLYWYGGTLQETASRREKSSGGIVVPPIWAYAHGMLHSDEILDMIAGEYTLKPFFGEYHRAPLSDETIRKLLGEKSVLEYVEGDGFNEHLNLTNDERTRTDFIEAHIRGYYPELVELKKGELKGKNAKQQWSKYSEYKRKQLEEKPLRKHIEQLLTGRIERKGIFDGINTIFTTSYDRVAFSSTMLYGNKERSFVYLIHQVDLHDKAEQQAYAEGGELTNPHKKDGVVEAEYSHYGLVFGIPVSLVNKHSLEFREFVEKHRTYAQCVFLMDNQQLDQLVERVCSIRADSHFWRTYISKPNEEITLNFLRRVKEEQDDGSIKNVFGVIGWEDAGQHAPGVLINEPNYRPMAYTAEEFKKIREALGKMETPTAEELKRLLRIN